MRNVIAIMVFFVSSFHILAQESVLDSTTFFNDCCWETAPQFPGGQIAMNEFLKQNLKYPDSSKKMGIEGKVYVSFIVDTLGNLTNIQILQGLSNEINNEVFRLFSIMPDWIPGMCSNGKKRRMQLNLPFLFKITP